MEEYTLFDVEKDYYLGDYTRCISKTNSMQASRETVYYRCLSNYHLKKYDILNIDLSKCKDQCVKLITYLVDYDKKPDQRDAIISKLEEEVKSVDPKDDLSRLVISSIYTREKQYSNALKVLHKLDTLAALFAQVNIFILMNRVDLAERQLKLMQTKDDFATLTSLALAQVRLVSNGPGEAYDVATELAKNNDREDASPLILNIQTAAAILLGDLDTAKIHCQNSLDKDSNNIEAMINMIFILSKMRASNEAKSRIFNQLKTLNPDHDYVKEFDRLDTEFQSIKS